MLTDQEKALNKKFNDGMFVGFILTIIFVLTVQALTYFIPYAYRKIHTMFESVPVYEFQELEEDTGIDI